MSLIMKTLLKKLADSCGYHISKKSQKCPALFSSDAPKILLGTYHKTGTVWLASIFEEICHKTGRVWIDLSEIYWGREEAMLEPIESAPAGAVIFEYHSKFPAIPDPSRYRGLRMVRDPRDVIISSVRYHRKSGESWLHETKEEFDGKTYQEYLNQITDPLEAFQFELDHIGGYSIGEMVQFKNPQLFIPAKYEEMIADVSMILWHQAFVDLGFQGYELPICLKATWKNSLFGAKSKGGSHILNGASYQWKEGCTKEMLEAFYSKFPDACSILGYEQ